MINGIRLKVCGLTSPVAAAAAAAAGADYLGFIFYPQSPRHVSLEQFRAMAKRLPEGKKVAVSVEPSLAELAALKAEGFDCFQIHFHHDLPSRTVAGWAEAVGADRLWLAPKLPPEMDLPAGLLPMAECFLLDAFHVAGYGGSGMTGDWQKYARHHQAHPGKTWILAGGLSPENIARAVTESGAKFIDVNSGVESAPGVKDAAKLQRLAAALREGREARGDGQEARG